MDVCEASRMTERCVAVLESWHLKNGGTSRTGFFFRLAPQGSHGRGKRGSAFQDIHLPCIDGDMPASESVSLDTIKFQMLVLFRSVGTFPQFFWRTVGDFLQRLKVLNLAD